MRRALALALLCLFIAPRANAATILTGDRIDSVDVIDKLDVTDRPAGSSAHYYFRVMDQALGQGWYVPVIVIKGVRSGPKLLLTAGIHGDELSGIAAIQQIVKDIDPKTLSGSVVAVPGLNTPGLLHSTRGFTPTTSRSDDGNLNRLMPGNSNSDSPAEIYAARLWNGLIWGNADIVIDMHTQSHGTVYPLYAFAKTAAARHIADLIQPDIINMDPGVKGSVETTLDDDGVTAITLEMGGAEVFDPQMIARAVRGVRNVMIDQGMIAGQIDLSGPTPYVGNTDLDVTTPRGGYAHLKVALGDVVKAGQTLAVVTDPFGDAVATVTSPQDGKVLSMATDPRRDQGDMLVRVIYWSPTGVCAQTGCPANAPVPKN
jgi:predicted deacylase